MTCKYPINPITNVLVTVTRDIIIIFILLMNLLTQGTKGAAFHLSSTTQHCRTILHTDTVHGAAIHDAPIIKKRI
jgi:hypothetical protein